MRSAPPAWPHQARFATGDPEQAREFLDRAYGVGGLRVTAIAEGGCSVDFTEVSAGEFASSRVNLGAELEFTLGARDGILISTVFAGVAAYERGKHTASYGPGDTYVGSYPDAGWTCHTEQADVGVVTVSEALLREVTDHPPERPWRPRAYEAPPAQLAQWHDTVRFIEDTLTRPNAADTPLIIGSAGRLLAAMVVAMFPPAGAPDSSSALASDRRDSHSHTLRRAIAFIESCPDREVTVQDIARAAWVTPRALQLAFRRHLDTTPMAYLRSVRLHAAHEQLLHSTPRQTTVALVAARWGFSHLNRFTRAYRATYGVFPSQTLHGRDLSPPTPTHPAT